RLDRGHANAGAVQVGAQVQRELAHEGLGPAVDVAAGVRIIARDRGDIDHRALAFDQARQELVGDRNQRGHIGLDHRLPLVETALLRRRSAEREAGIVYQQVDVRERLRQRIERGVARRLGAHVEHSGVHLVRAEVRNQLLQPLRPAPRSNAAPAAGDEAAHAGLADPRSRSGDKRRPAHALSSAPCLPAAATIRSEIALMSASVKLFSPGCSTTSTATDLRPSGTLWPAKTSNTRASTIACLSALLTARTRSPAASSAGTRNAKSRVTGCSAGGE